MTNKDSDINQSIPESLQKLYEILKEEVLWLNSEWKIFCQLFAFSEERIKFLAEMAPNFFGIIQEVLRDEIFISLCRLTDPPMTGNKENLSLARLVEQIGEFDKSEFHSNTLEEIKSHCEPFRDWRNRKIAHKDLPTTLEYHPDPLPGISKKMIDEALRMICDLLNNISEKLWDFETDYEHIFMEDNGETIIHYLEHAKESLRRKKNK